uniref:Putative salivary kunitz domain protein n=1 Tax=Ixodes ricinus TaxID=34613 RepID=A0A0K8R755_IXORI
MQFIFVACLVILACSVLDTQGMPGKCYLPEDYEDPRCRAHSGRYFYDPKTSGCKKFYGCWDTDDGYFNKRECRKECKGK